MEEEIKFSFLFPIVLILVFGFCFVALIFEAISHKSTFKKLLNIILFVLPSFCFISLGVFLILIEYNLLVNYEYVDGKTIGYCNSSKDKIEFEYTYNNQKYIECSKYQSNNNFQVPNGKYKVRVSKFSPTDGRIDIDKPILTETK